MIANPFLRHDVDGFETRPDRSWLMQTLTELVASANRAHRQGRLSEALTFCEQALELDPNACPALLLLGVVAYKRRAFKVAIENLEHAGDVDPNAFQPPFWLSLAYRSYQMPHEALKASRRAVELDPRQGSAFNQLGLCHLDLGQFEEAEEAFRKAIILDPNVSTVHENLGRALHRQRRLKEALAAYERAIDLDPTKERVILRLGNALVTELDYTSALHFGLRVATTDAGFLLMARALVGQGKADEAESYAARALSHDSQSPEAHSVYASVMDALGRITEAREHYSKSLELKPKQAFPYYALARGQRDDGLIDRILPLLDDPLVENRAYLFYALGKAYEDQDRYEEAMANYDKANRLENHPGFASLDQPDFAEQDFGSDSELPILVVGMMRSGTTLIEQILSSHHQIGGAGELPFWAGHTRSTCNPVELAEEYLNLLTSLVPGQSRVVDKMPDNYRRLGLIHRVLPRARIVHVRRDPLDTCMSLWSTPRAYPPAWGGTKEGVVEEYRRYLELMEDLRLPDEVFLEVRYEDLVSEPEPVIRRLVTFTGLEWDEACLHPEANRRSVTTPSVVQVRKGIDARSVGRWRKFEPWLGEFAALREPSQCH